jgi:hypothetical protein
LGKRVTQTFLKDLLFLNCVELLASFEQKKIIKEKCLWQTNQCNRRRLPQISQIIGGKSGVSPLLDHIRVRE